MSDIWIDYLNNIEEYLSELNNIITKYKISTKVNLEEYDFDSGYLLNNIPQENKNSIYQFYICDLLYEIASKYAEWNLKECYNFQLKDLY